MKKKIKVDLILIAVLFVSALLALFIIRQNSSVGAFVRVSIDGESAGEYSLFENGEYSLNGGTNILVIEDGYAYMKAADCPDSLCVKTGRISHTGQRIVCLPNRVLVEIAGEGDEILGG